MDGRVNLMEVDGVNVLLEYSDAVNAKEHEWIDASPLVMDESEFPLVARGFFDNTGVWRFFATFPESEEHQMEYDDFVVALHNTR